MSRGYDAHIRLRANASLSSSPPPGSSVVAEQVTTLIDSGDVTVDHGSQTGLGDNDHPQYPQAGETEEVTGDWEFSGAATFTGTLGAFGASAVGQQTAPSTQSSTSVSGSGDDSTINDNFAAHDTAINALKTALDAFGFTST